jgi:hypothetical protein
MSATAGTIVKPTTENLKGYIREELEKTTIIEPLERMIRDHSSTAGGFREGVFCREFLCPTIGRFFYEHVRSELNLPDEEIKKGLGAEGFQHCRGFGFTPAKKNKHLFTKQDVIKSGPPELWFAASEEKLSPLWACPDFAIQSPLPFSIVGEAKYFTKGTPEKAVRELYDTARQAVFYLGAFPKSYDAAMIVIADASPDHAFHQGLQLLKPELLQRFGSETKVHLVTIRIR